jgi:hypothetical protein
VGNACEQSVIIYHCAYCIYKTVIERRKEAQTSQYFRSHRVTGGSHENRFQYRERHRWVTDYMLNVEDQSSCSEIMYS